LPNAATLSISPKEQLALAHSARASTTEKKVLWHQSLKCDVDKEEDFVQLLLGARQHPLVAHAGAGLGESATKQLSIQFI
jgi:hypothetical protein